MNGAVNELLNDLNVLLQQEANEKVKKAMQLFIRCDDIYKHIVLHSTGFTDKATAKNLREHFDILDVLDMLDSCIDDMTDDIKYS